MVNSSKLTLQWLRGPRGACVDAEQGQEMMWVTLALFLSTGNRLLATKIGQTGE